MLGPSSTDPMKPGAVLCRYRSNGGMADRPTEYELSVEQELPAAPDGGRRRARLTARFRSDVPGAAPDDAEVARSLRELADRLRRAAEASGVGARSPDEARPDRSLEELVETYRPRQPELLELLHADGELTDGEFERLRSQVPAQSTEKSEGMPAVPSPPGPSLAGGRSVAELLRTYQITSLRQAGAVRGRRQISFDEYMALKRHFAETSPDDGPRPG